MPFYTYLARCSDGSLYTGSCENLQNREAEHNKGKGAKYTSERRPVTIVYHEQFQTLLEAMKREQQIKGWTRKKKEGLVLYSHPTLVRSLN
jgi:predicted GIY-YIG superfamily endonuclease